MCKQCRNWLQTCALMRINSVWYFLVICIFVETEEAVLCSCVQTSDIVWPMNAWTKTYTQSHTHMSGECVLSRVNIKQAKEAIVKRTTHNNMVLHIQSLLVPKEWRKKKIYLVENKMGQRCYVATNVRRQKQKKPNKKMIPFCLIYCNKSKY